MTTETKAKPSDLIGTRFKTACLREVSIRYFGPRRASFTFREPRQVAEFARSILRDDAREHFIALFLDAGHSVVSYSLLSIGTANSTQVHLRELFQFAIAAGACAIAVAHNHPSGRLDISDSDQILTERLVEAGEFLGIPVLDHVVFTRSDFTSFVSEGRLSRMERARGSSAPRLLSVEFESESRPAIPDELKQEIRNLLDYLHDDEAKSFESLDEVERDGHIFKSIRTVDQWLSRMR